jgi:hypothetical protein
MSTQVTLGLVDTEELSRVFDALWMMRKEGKTLPGIVVFCEDGRRRWWIPGDKLSILITGDAADFSGAYRLPLTIMANAGRQNAANGAVTYTIGGDAATGLTVTADSMRGKQTVSCESIPVPEHPRAEFAAGCASAKLSGKDLAWTVFAGAHPPFEAIMLEEDDDRQSPDHFMMTIEKKRFTVASDWTQAGMYNMVGSTAAVTKGSGSIRLDPDFLNVLSNCVDAESEWTVCFGLDGQTIVLESDAQYIVSQLTKVPVHEMKERVLKVLERDKFEHHVVGTTKIGVRVDGVPVSVEMFAREGDESPLLGLSSVIVREANESPELLREINAHNQAGSLTRLWHENGKVLLGIDLLADNLSVLTSRLRHLARVAKDMSGMLEPFAAEAALPPKRRFRRKKTPTVQPEVWD